MPLGRYLLIIGVLSKLDVDRENGCIRDNERAYSREGGLAVLQATSPRMVVSSRPPVWMKVSWYSLDRRVSL
jgi:hypothetical protein